MNVFEEITSKYPAYYNQDGKKVVTGPEGKLYFDAKETIVNINGSLITIYSVDYGGIVPSEEPIRIVLFLKKPSELGLKIFPKEGLKKLFQFFVPGKSVRIPSKIRNQFSFKGNEELINKLVSDRVFIENIINEKIYIVINKKTSQNVLLTPAFGITSVEQFEKFVKVLKSIELKISTTNDYS